MAFNINEMSNNWNEFKTAVKNYFNKSLDKTGDTMTGRLMLSNPPEENFEAVTKQYVDNFWKFRPGNDYVFNMSQSNGEYGALSSNELYAYSDNSYQYQVGNKLDNNNFLQSDDVGKTFKKTVSFKMTPGADGELILNLGSAYYAFRGQGLIYYSTSYKLSEADDVIYNIKVSYCVDGFSDVVLYENTNISAYNPLLPDAITVNIPITRNVTGANIVTEYTIVNIKGLALGRRLTGTRGTNKTFTLSMSNPLFQL